ncbi:MAG: hypothetical protein J6K43_03165 [Lachnospiraceae bacterium]|nr:hypothetical protein [Lachnospiraceae bacterium]
MEELIKIIKKYVPDIELNIEQALLDDALIDSIQLVEMICDISEQFQIDISGDDIDPDNFQSIQTIWQLILRLKGK